MILGGSGAAVADEDITGHLLADHDLHLIPQEVDHVEIGDVDLVVTIKTLLLVDRLRGGHALVDLEHLVHLALVVLAVKRKALRTGLVLGQIRVRGLDTGERGVTGAVEHDVDPVGVALVQVRLVADLTRIREEHLDVLDAVGLTGVLHPLLGIVAERAVVLGLGQEFLHVVVGQDRSFILGTGLFEGVHMHNISFFLRMGGAIVVLSVTVLSVGITLLDGEADKSIGDILLFLVQRVEDILNGLAGRRIVRLVISVRNIRLRNTLLGTTNGRADKSIYSVLLLVGKSVPDLLDGFVRRFRGRIVLGLGGRRFGIVGMLHVILAFLIAMLEHDLLAGIDHGLIVKEVLSSIRMLESNVVDVGARIGAGKDEAHLADVTVHDVLVTLGQMVRVDRERGDVTVLDELLGVATHRCAVERAIAIDAILTVLQHSMAEHVVDVAMVMLVDQRHLLTVLIGEGVLQNGSPVGATDVVPRGVTTEIIPHFDCLLPWGSSAHPEWWAVPTLGLVLVWIPAAHRPPDSGPSHRFPTD